MLTSFSAVVRELFKVEFGAVEIGLGGFIFPLHGLPVEERQVDGGGATQQRELNALWLFQTTCSSSRPM